MAEPTDDLPPRTDTEPDHSAAGDVVVLVDDAGSPVGTAPRATVHDADTPLHLAFSCYLFDGRGQVLLTRRAVGKRTWPGVWTNSFCGHPRPGEAMTDAITRYAAHELGTTLTDLRCVLPDFRYRAVDPAGVVENEICPVYLAVVAGDLAPAPEEVEEARWLPLHELRAALAAAPWALSPWLVEQFAQIERSGAWPVAA